MNMINQVEYFKDILGTSKRNHTITVTTKYRNYPEQERVNSSLKYLYEARRGDILCLNHPLSLFYIRFISVSCCG